MTKRKNKGAKEEILREDAPMDATTVDETALKAVEAPDQSTTHDLADKEAKHVMELLSDRKDKIVAARGSSSFDASPDAEQAIKSALVTCHILHDKAGEDSLKVEELTDLLSSYDNVVEVEGMDEDGNVRFAPSWPFSGNGIADDVVAAGITTEEIFGGATKKALPIKAIAGGAAAIAAIAGLALLGPKNKPAQPAATPQPAPIEQSASVEPEPEAKPEPTQAADKTLSAEELGELIGKLSFDGADIAEDLGDIDVDVQQGKVVVSEKKDLEAHDMVDKAAKRSAALASELKDAKVDGKAVERVIWHISDTAGDLQVAVEQEPAKAPNAGDTADVLAKAVGWDMTEKAAEAVKDKGIAKSGGAAPSDGTGKAVIPEKKIEDEAKDDDKPAENAASEAEAPAAEGGEDSQQNAGTQQAAQPAPAPEQTTPATPSQPAPAQPQPSTPEKRWVVDQAAWDEWVVDQAAWDETVVDQAAWDEPIYETQQVSVGAEPVYEERSYYRMSDGAIFYNSEEARSYREQKALAGEGVTASVEYETVQVGTREIYESRQVQTGTVHHDAVTHVVHHDEVGHWVHHDEVGHWE